MFYIFNINVFCQNLSPILYLIGQLLGIFKICLPLILIILSIFDIGKAIISSKTDDVKKNMKSFFKKILICLVVFFIPVIGIVVFSFIGDFAEIREYSGIDFDVCYDCVFNPTSDTCTSAVDTIEASK